MPSLTDLPNELLMEIASYYFCQAPDAASKPSPELLNLILVSRRWRQVAEPYLYQRIHLSFRTPRRNALRALIPLIRTLFNRPGLSELCRSLSLDTGLRDIFTQRRKDGETPVEIGPVNEIMTRVISLPYDEYDDPSDEGGYLILLLHLLPKLDVLMISNVREFSIRCFAFNIDPKCGFQIPAGLQSITQLILRNVNATSQPQYSFIPALITLPNLRQVTLKFFHEISLHHRDAQPQPDGMDRMGTSSLVSFRSFNSILGLETMGHILKIPVHLESINIDHCFWKQGMDSKPLFQLFRHQCHSLKYLKLNIRNFSVSTSWSFAEFSQLQYLGIGCKSLLGEAPFPEAFSQHSKEFSHTFFAVLPPSLEELEIWINGDWTPALFLNFIGGAKNKATWDCRRQKYLPCLKRFVIHARTIHKMLCMSELELFGIEVLE